MSSNRTNTSRKRNNAKRNQNKKRKDTRMVVTHGYGQPQGYPFAPDRRIVKRCVRYFQAGVTTDGGGNLLFRVSLRNLSRAVNGAGTYSDASSLAAVYDCYKPVALRIQMVPTFAVGNFSVGSVVLAPDYEDNDTSQVVATVVDANQYNERQVLDPRRPSVVTFRVPSLSSGTVPGLTSTSPVTVQSGGFLDFNSPPYDGVVYVVGGNFPSNFPVFDLFLEMDLLLKFAR